MWDLNNVYNYPLLSNQNSNSHLGNYKKILKNYLPINLKNDFKKNNLVGSVHIEAGWKEDSAIDEVKWLEKIIKHSNFEQVIVAYAKLDDPNIENYLNNLINFKSVKGIRMRLVENINDLKVEDNLLNNSSWLKGFKILKNYKYSFELQASFRISFDVYNFIKKNDDINIIISHAAFPNYQNSEEKKEWMKFIEKISFFNNVYLKISGIPMMFKSLNISEMNFIINHCIDTLGPDKLIFGSNLPIENIFCNSDDLIKAYFDIFNTFGKENFYKITYKNAKEFYNFIKN